MKHISASVLLISSTSMAFQPLHLNNQKFNSALNSIGGFSDYSNRQMSDAEKNGNRYYYEEYKTQDQAEFRKMVERERVNLKEEQRKELYSICEFAGIEVDKVKKSSDLSDYDLFLEDLDEEYGGVFDEDVSPKAADTEAGFEGDTGRLYDENGDIQFEFEPDKGPAGYGANPNAPKDTGYSDYEGETEFFDLYAAEDDY
mmetsp:Transcript_15547/g.17257  ORF Transcript_15547/g.17257 Transcript_15547/m.17257 type:complete len:200 (-) Transcript_15547:172-771(-)